jgi:hypothetical protein
MTGDDPIVDTAGVAVIAGGIATDSVRIYLKRSRARLREGLDLRAHDLPLPDYQIGRSPAWRTSSIERWIQARQNRRVGDV